MTTLEGMDPQEVRNLASRIRVQADAITSVVTGLDATVDQLNGNWRGHDAVEFVSWWQQQHRPALLRARDAVAGLAQSADNNASQQESTSASAGSGLGATVGVVAGVTAATGAAVGAAAAPSSPGGGSSAAAAGSAAASRAGIMNGFAAAYPVGSTVGPGDSRGQCVGLFEEYTMKYVHTPEVFLGPYGTGASNLYTHFNDIAALRDNYVQVPATGVPQPGDVAVWDASTPYSDGYGHVAIVTGVSGDAVHIIQQNVVPNHVSDGQFTAGNEPHLLGYLRPKNLQ